MSDEVEVVLELIEEVLGEPRKVYDSKLQYGYNCIECDEGKGKGNLEVSLEKHLFHCWSCGISGPLGKLFDEYGNKKLKKTYLLIRPDEFKVEEKKKNILRLPQGYTKILEASPIYPPHKEAFNYLKSRGITDEMCERCNIGLTTTGDFQGRIIIPSYDKDGKLNYFIARSWNPRAKMKYKNPPCEKDQIIFNEKLINWDEDIYLVEGAFDSIFVKNSIPMLGKHLSELLFTNLYNKAKKNVIICLDGDAFNNAVELYHTLNGGVLYNRVKLVKLPDEKDIADLRGEIRDEYYFEIK
jgi:DNA primase